MKILKFLLYPFYWLAQSDATLRYELGKKHNCLCVSVKITGNSGIFGDNYSGLGYNAKFDFNKPNVREYKTFKEFINNWNVK